MISHGLAEHGGRYAGLAERLVGHGHAVYAIDHRGHGRSSGQRANIDRFAYLVSDLGTFVGRAQREHPDLPVFLLGHSMGGAIAFACALRIPGDVEGSRVVGTRARGRAGRVDVQGCDPAHAVGRSARAPAALTFPAAAVSRDPAVVRAYESDPLVLPRPDPGAHGRRAARCDGSASRPGAELRKLPVLVQHGTADSLVPLAATRPIYATWAAEEQRTLPALRRASTTRSTTSPSATA